jgi:hypothetical protein
MNNITWMISVFRREVDENWSLLSYYAESSANALTTFRNNVSVIPSWVKNPRRKLWISSNRNNSPKGTN